MKPTLPLNFFDDSGPIAAINDLGIVITDDIPGTDTGKVVTQNANLKYYQVTIKHLKFNKCPIWHFWHGGKEVS